MRLERHCMHPCSEYAQAIADIKKICNHNGSGSVVRHVAASSCCKPLPRSAAMGGFCSRRAQNEQEEDFTVQDANGKAVLPQVPTALIFDGAGHALWRECDDVSPARVGTRRPVTYGDADDM